MKLIHTADWHLGQTFFGYERAAEHIRFLGWLSSLIVEQSIDVLLVAGDLFDGPNPSAASQKIFFDFIRKVTSENPLLKVVITAGNHDSGARLEAPSPLLDSMGVTVRGVLQRTADGDIDYDHHIIPIDEKVCCLAVPYLRQGDYPPSDSYAQGVRMMYENLVKRAGERFPLIVAMGHIHATGADVSLDDRAERTVVGGLDCVDVSAVSEQFAYMALGHLHKAQSVAHCSNVRYSGSPLPMSFAERNNRQSVTLVTIDDNATVVEKVPFDSPVKLVSIPNEPKSLDCVLDEIAQLQRGEVNDFSPFLEIRVAISEPEPDMRQKIEEALDGCAMRLARIEAVTQRGNEDIRQILSYEELKSIDPMIIAEEIFCRSYGQKELPQNMKELLGEVIKEVQV